MRYTRVCLEAFGYTLPEEVVSTEQLEGWLSPIYERLRLPAGRLELITGIRERRFWPPGSVPSDESVKSGESAIRAAGIDRDEIGALIHGSVCRDYLEPATASGVHHRLGLRSDCLVYDVSNACLGILDGMLQVANMIELGQIRAGLVVGTENARPLVETTVKTLNTDASLTRDAIKPAIASLTIGSGSCAVLLCDRDLSRTGNHITAAVARANTDHHQLCHSGNDEAGAAMQPLMDTDSEQLMHEGIATGAETFELFLAETTWARDEIDKTFCHQVTTTHRKLLFEAFGLETAIDFPTVEFLGNTGSVALPISMAMGIELGRLSVGDHVALLGIGSGINCLMLGVEWQTSPLVSTGEVATPQSAAV